MALNEKYLKSLQEELDLTKDKHNELNFEINVYLKNPNRKIRKSAEKHILEEYEEIKSEFSETYDLKTSFWGIKEIILNLTPSNIVNEISYQKNVPSDRYLDKINDFYHDLKLAVDVKTAQELDLIGSPEILKTINEKDFYELIKKAQSEKNISDEEFSIKRENIHSRYLIGNMGIDEMYSEVKQVVENARKAKESKDVPKIKEHNKDLDVYLSILKSKEITTDKMLETDYDIKTRDIDEIYTDEKNKRKGHKKALIFFTATTGGFGILGGLAGIKFDQNPIIDIIYDDVTETLTVTAKDLNEYLLFGADGISEIRISEKDDTGEKVHLKTFLFDGKNSTEEIKIEIEELVKYFDPEKELTLEVTAFDNEDGWWEDDNPEELTIPAKVADEEEEEIIPTPTPIEELGNIIYWADSKNIISAEDYGILMDRIIEESEETRDTLTDIFSVDNSTDLILEDGYTPSIIYYNDDIDKGPAGILIELVPDKDIDEKDKIPERTEDDISLDDAVKGSFRTEDRLGHPFEDLDKHDKEKAPAGMVLTELERVIDEEEGRNNNKYIIIGFDATEERLRIENSGRPWEQVELIKDMFSSLFPSGGGSAGTTPADSDSGGGRDGGVSRRRDPSRGRVQAQELALLLPGTGKGGPRPPG